MATVAAKPRSAQASGEQGFHLPDRNEDGDRSCLLSPPCPPDRAKQYHRNESFKEKHHHEALSSVQAKPYLILDPHPYPLRTGSNEIRNATSRYIPP